MRNRNIFNFKYQSLCVIIGFLILFLGCSTNRSIQKDERKNHQQLIREIIPAEGTGGDKVVIQGSFGNTSLADISIRFANEEARIIERDSSGLIVEVPRGVPEGEVPVKLIAGAHSIDVLKKFKAYRPVFKSDYPYPVNLIYFSQPDNPPLPFYEQRFSEIMLEVQGFFQKWMSHWGYDQTFGLLKDDAHQRVKITHIVGKHSYKEYPYKGGGQRVIREVEAYFREHPGEKRGEHTFIVLPHWPGSDEGGPFYGLGKIAFAADNEYMDLSLLGNGPKGKGATKYIGGLIHELGHSLNLPHNRQTLTEGNDPGFGMALMSAGNFTFGQKPTFITKASAAILSKAQPLSKSKGDFYGKVSAQLNRISGRAENDKIIVEGTFTADHPVSSVIVYNYNPENEYLSVPMVVAPEENSRFSVSIPVGEIEENKKKEYHISLRFVFENGSTIDVAGPGFKIENGKADISFDYSNRDEFKSFSREGWNVADFSSEERGEGNATHVLDGDYSTFWHSRWSKEPEKFPHSLTIDMGESKEVEGFSFVQREFGRRVKDFSIEVSEDGESWTSAGDFRLISIPFPQQIHLREKKKFRYFKIISHSSWDGAGHSSLAEIGAF